MASPRNMQRAWMDRLQEHARLWRLFHALVLLSPVLGLLLWLGNPSTNGPSGAVDCVLAAYLLWPGYLFWWLDRAIARRLAPLNLQALLRALLLVPFVWSPGAWIVALVNGMRAQRSRSSLNSYIACYPDCYRNNKVYCHACGGGNIWMIKRLSMPGYTEHSHTCRQCGIELYRSVWR